MTYKTHLHSEEPKHLTACNLIDPNMPREAVNITTDWSLVTCGACRRTGEWFTARQAANAR